MHRHQFDAELEEEIRLHLELRQQEHLESGMTEGDARAAARRWFGNVTSLREKSHIAWGWEWFEGLVQDVRYGLRALRKNPGFTVVAVLTLALGIGANTAIFSVVEAVLLRPLPFHEPDRVVQILETTSGLPYTSASGEDYLDWESQNRTLEGSSITTWTQNYNASGAGQPETVSVVRAEANFFSVIGAQPFIGSSFALDSSISLFNVRTMNQVVAQNMEDTSLQSALLGIFAGLALVLAAVGVYGVMAYLVTHRTHEIGIRIALGAQPRQVLSQVMGHGARLAALGVAIGTVAALMLTRLMSSLLFGVVPTDAATFSAATVFLLAIAVLACCIPAWRAMRVDPMVALRNE